MREQVDVGHRRVQALGAGRRHDVRGVAGQEQPLVLHRLDDERAHRRDALLEDRPAVDRHPEAAVELVPDRVVGPRLLVGLALQVHAGDLRRAQRGEREAALVVGVDQLLRAAARTRPGSPSSRTGTRARRPSGRRRSWAGRRRGSRRSPRSRRPPAPAGEPSCVNSTRAADVDLHVGDLEVQRQPGLQPRADQVLDDLLLAVDRDRAPAGQVATARSGGPRRRSAARRPRGPGPARASARRARPRPSGPSWPARARRRARAAARRSDRAPRGSRTRSPATRAAGRASAQRGRLPRSPPGYACGRAYLIPFAPRTLVHYANICRDHFPRRRRFRSGP